MGPARACGGPNAFEPWSPPEGTSPGRPHLDGPPADGPPADRPHPGGRHPGGAPPLEPGDEVAGLSCRDRTRGLAIATRRDDTKDRSEDRDPAGALEELFDLSKRYVLQETVDPLRSLGKRLVYGLGGAVFLGLGAIFLGTGFLRLTTRHVGVASRGALSAVPYIVAGFGLIGFLLVAWRLGYRVEPKHRKTGRQGSETE